MVKNLKHVLEKMPNTLKENLLFQNIIEKVYEKIKDKETSSERIVLKKDLIDEDLKEKNIDLIESDMDGFLMSYQYCTDELEINVDIYQEDNAYDVEVSFSLTNEEKQISIITLNVLPHDYTIIKEDLLKKGPFFKDATFEVHYFNGKYEEVDKEQALEHEDSVFLSYFLVPEEKAREYRLNFKKHIQEINKENIIRAMKDNADELLYTFRPPVTYDNLLIFFLIEATKESDFMDSHLALLEEDSVIQEYDEDDYYSIEDDLNDQDEKIFNTPKWNKFVEFFENTFGKTGFFIFSENLIDNLLLYFMIDELQILDTTGMVIKRENDEFTQYFVHFTQDEVIVIPKKISQEYLANLYSLDEFNEKTYGLNLFLGNDEGRKL